jgi:hypothetical protein
MVLGAMNPGRMPWAGMNDAFGVSEGSPELHRACLEEIRPAPAASVHPVNAFLFRVVG